MKSLIAEAVVGSLLLIPSTPAIADYPRAAEIKRACAPVIQEHFRSTQERYKVPTSKAKQNEIVDGWINSFSKVSTEEAREEWKFSGADFTKCIVNQLEAHRAEGKVAPAPAAASSAVQTPDIDSDAPDGKTKPGCPAANMVCPPPKGTVFRHIVKLGSQCVDATLLQTEHYNGMVEIELVNNCTKSQVISTYVETADISLPGFSTPLGPPYYPWLGKYPPTFNFQAVEPNHPFTMYPRQKISLLVQGGKTTTLKTAACDYAGPDNVFIRIYTDSSLQGFTVAACVPNPEPPPKPRWPL